ncbi:MAG: hypothetical protein NC904_08160, partial [Candidatus Omnitrophica bacterium]|nr:hypothetical protein [Candidatus Omnitrophota bacterium]
MRGEVLYIFSMVIIAIFSLLFCFLLGRKVKEKYLRIFSAALLFTVFLWSLGRAFLVMASSKEVAIFWLKVSYTGSILMPLAFYLFICSFLNIGYRRIGFFPFLLLVIILLFVNFTPLFITEVKPKLCFRFYETSKSIFFYLFVLMYTAVLIWGHYKLLQAYKRTKSVRREQIKYIFLSSLVGFLPSSTTFPLAFDIPLYPLGVPFICFYPLVIAYAIIRHRLMDIRVAVTKAGIFFILYAIVLGIPFYVGYRTGSW